MRRLYESGDSTGEVSLNELFHGGGEIDGGSDIGIDRLAFLVCRGGWPQAVDMRDEIALDQAVDYYDAVVHSDINRADCVQRKTTTAEQIAASILYMDDPEKKEQNIAMSELSPRLRTAPLPSSLRFKISSAIRFLYFFIRNTSIQFI